MSVESVTYREGPKTQPPLRDSEDFSSFVTQHWVRQNQPNHAGLLSIVLGGTQEESPVEKAGPAKGKATTETPPKLKKLRIGFHIPGLGLAETAKPCFVATRVRLESLTYTFSSSPGLLVFSIEPSTRSANTAERCWAIFGRPLAGLTEMILAQHAAHYKEKAPSLRLRLGRAEARPIGEAVWVANLRRREGSHLTLVGRVGEERLGGGGPGGGADVRGDFRQGHENETA